MIAKDLTFFGAPKSPQEYVDKGVRTFWDAQVEGSDLRIEESRSRELVSELRVRRKQVECSAMFTAEHSRGGTLGQLVGGTVEVQVAHKICNLAGRQA